MSATSAPPVTLKSNFDATKVVMKSIKCTAGEDIGYAHKVDFPRFEGREEDPVEEMLTFCRDFFDGISQFTFQDEQKAIRGHYDIFNSLLLGDAKSRWRVCLNETSVGATSYF